MRRAFILLGLLLSVPAQASGLRVGLADATTSLDPLFTVAGANTEIALNLFDPLIRQDARQHLVPALATAWRRVDDTTWDFTLRPNVRFHDGSAFGAEDVIASVRHVAGIANSPSSFRHYIAGISAMEAISPTSLRIHTNGPRPLLPNDLSRIAIIPRALQDAPAAGFEHAVGTGPYRLVSWARGSSVAMARNTDDWRPPAAWDQVEMRTVSDPGARAAAMLAGDLDLIAAVPAEAQAVLARSGKVRIVDTAGNRLIYLHLDSNRAVSPFVRDAAGKPLEPNPLRDRRVRLALSLAIDRTALVERVMDGQSTPAGQLMPPGYVGYDPALAAPAQDLARARALLAEAGFPQGFSLTLHGPNDRYPNDARLVQAVAQGFTRAGVRTAVDVQPGASFFTRASALEFSMILGGAAIETGEPTGILNPLLATFDAPRGLGSGNRGRWSNARFDTLLAQAYATFDDAQREDLLKQATRIAVDDVGIIPVLFLQQSWALRNGLDMVPRSDGYTLAADIAVSQ